MNILHVYKQYYPDSIGGLEESIRQITFSTSKAGFNNRIYTLTRSSERFSDLPEASVYRAKSWFDISSCDVGLYSSYRLFKRQCEWADIVHFHFPWPFSDLLKFVSRDKTPSVMTYHSDVIGKGLLGYIYKPIMRKMLHSIDRIVPTSQNYASTSQDLSQIPVDKVTIIPLGINEATYEATLVENDDIDVCKEYDLNEGRFFFFVGANRIYKGLETLVKAASNVECEIVIAGKDTDKKYGIPSENLNNVRFLGYISDRVKMALMAKCRAVVLPSTMRSEAFGMVLVEASMMGKPMITTEIGTGTSFVNINKVTGLTVEPNNVSNLIEAIKKLYYDGDMAHSFGVAARERYKTELSGDIMGRKYADLYNLLV